MLTYVRIVPALHKSNAAFDKTGLTIPAPEIAVAKAKPLTSHITEHGVLLFAQAIKLAGFIERDFGTGN